MYFKKINLISYLGIPASVLHIRPVWLSIWPKRTFPYTSHKLSYISLDALPAYQMPFCIKFCYFEL